MPLGFCLSGFCLGDKSLVGQKPKVPFPTLLLLVQKPVIVIYGQGCAERQNKNTKKHRTVVRNRQSHIVTKAYMEIDSVLRMELLRRHSRIV